MFFQLLREAPVAIQHINTLAQVNILNLRTCRFTRWRQEAQKVQIEDEPERRQAQKEVAQKEEKEEVQVKERLQDLPKQGGSSCSGGRRGRERSGDCERSRRTADRSEHETVRIEQRRRGRR